MTKYYLHGGESDDGAGMDVDYFTHFLDFNEKKHVNLLLVYFARPVAKWPYLFDADKKIVKQSTDKSIEIKDATFANFLNELLWADAVFFKGGDGPTLTNHLSHYPNLKELFKDKNIGGTSAGVNTLSKYYYSRRGHRVIKGLGIINIKAFTHFETGLKNEYQDLKQTGENLQIVTIPEGEFVIVESDDNQ